MRPRLLFLSQCLPYPPHSGGANRTYNIARQLQEEFDVALVAFSRRNHQRDHAALTAALHVLRSELSLVAQPVPIRSEWSLARRLWNHGRAVTSGAPYVYFDYTDPRFGAQVADVVRRAPPALVHMDSLDLYRWLRVLPGVPIACTHHNIESDLLRLRARSASSQLLGMHIRHQAHLMERVEREITPTLDLNVMMSELDERRLHVLAPNARTTVAPNGVDTEFFRPMPDTTIEAGRIAFLGPTYMFPNHDGLSFFLREIWAKIRRAVPHATLHTIGRNAARDRVEFERFPGVTCLGYVPDVRPALAAAACSIVPLRAGGGTRLKILDSWAMGKAVVSTSIGCEGLAALDGENILVRDDADGFAEAVIAVLRDGTLRRRLEVGGRSTGEALYAWPTIGKKLRDTYRELLEHA